MSQLSAREWSLLDLNLRSALPAYCRIPAHQSFLQFIYNRTIPYKKFCEKIIYTEIMAGSHKKNIWGIGMDRFQCGRFCKLLNSQNVLFKYSKSSVIHINIYGMAQVVLHSRLSVTNPSEKFKAITLQLQNLIPKLEAIQGKMFPNPIHFYKEGTLMTLSEVTSKVRKEARIRKETKRKVKKTQPLKTTWLKDYFKECCEEFGRSFSDTPWTKKDWGQAKQWLSLCQDHEVDPRAWIKLAVEHWVKMASGKLLNKFGSKARLPGTVSFQSFYLHRNQILDYVKTLPVNGTRLTNKGGIAIIDLGGDIGKQKITTDLIRQFNNGEITKEDIKKMYHESVKRKEMA